MLETIPSWAMKLQHPIKVGVQWSVMSLAIGGLETEGKEVIRETDSPHLKNLGDEGLMNFRECGADNPVRANGLSEGEEHMAKDPWVAVGRFLESIIDHS